MKSAAHSRVGSLTLGALLPGLICLGLGLLIPIGWQYQQVRKSIDRLRDREAQVRVDVQQVKDLTRTLQTLAAEVDEQQKKANAAGDLALFLRGLEAEAARDQVRVERVTVDQKKAASGVRRLPVQLELAGPESGFIAVLRYLEKEEPLARLTGVTLTLDQAPPRSVIDMELQSP